MEKKPSPRTQADERRRRVQPAIEGAKRKRLLAKIYNAIELLNRFGFVLGAPPDLDDRIRDETGLPVFLAEDPLASVVLGTGKLLEDIELLRKVSFR